MKHDFVLPYQQAPCNIKHFWDHLNRKDFCTELTRRDFKKFQLPPVNSQHQPLQVPCLILSANLVGMPCESQTVRPL